MGGGVFGKQNRGDAQIDAQGEPLEEDVVGGEDLADRAPALDAALVPQAGRDFGTDFWRREESARSGRGFREVGDGLGIVSQEEQASAVGPETVSRSAAGHGRPAILAGVFPDGKRTGGGGLS